MAQHPQKPHASSATTSASTTGKGSGKHNSKLSANHTPKSVSRTSSSSSWGGKRLNNRPVWIASAVVVAVMAAIAFVSQSTQNRQAQMDQQQDPEQQKKSDEQGSRSLADKLFGNQQKSGMIDAAALPTDAASAPGSAASAPSESASTPDSKASDSRLTQNNSASSQPAAPTPAELEMERIRQAKQQQFEAAMRAPLRGNYNLPSRSASAMGGQAYATSSSGTSTNPALGVQQRLALLRQQIDQASSQSTDYDTAYRQRLASAQQIAAAMQNGGGQGLEQPPRPGAANQSVAAAANNMGLALGGAGANRWKLDQQVEAPTSPYEMRAGGVLPATLIGGINSELPGTLTAQVSQNVYDTASGQHLLIPQGTKLMGIYSSQVSFGQSRVMIAWNRLVFPDGKALDIGSMPGTDSAGYSGLSDQVNNHYVRTFASAFLMSTVTAGITYSQRRNDNNSAGDAGSALSESLGQQLGQTTAQIINKNLNVSPTLEIRPGFRFNVIVTKDLVFSKPYKNFDY